MATDSSDEKRASGVRFRQRLLTAALIVLTAALAVFAIYLIAGAQKATRARDIANEREHHTLTVLLASSSALYNTVEAQSAERGYLFTRNPAFLDLYDSAWADVGKFTANLKTLTRDNPRQMRNLSAFERMARLRRSEMDEIIAMARRDVLDENEIAIKFGQGKQTMDALRAAAGAIVMEERRILDLRRRELRNATVDAREANNLLAGLGLALIGLFAAALFASLRLRSLAIEQRIEAAALARNVETQKLLQLVIDSSEDPIYVKARDGTLVYINERVARIYGSTMENVVGRKDSDFLPADVASALRANDLAVMESGQPSTTEEVIFEQGQNVTFLSAKRPWRAGNDVVGIIGISRDITDLKREEQRLQGSNAELERRVSERTRELSDAVARLEAEANERELAETQLRQMQKMESIGKLSGGIAHDFNNMLAIVIGSLDLARKKLPEGTPEPVLANLSDAQEGASRAAQLTARLLAYARQQPLAPKSVELNALISDVCRVLERTLGDTIELDVHLAPAMGAIYIDALQLENAIINIAVNARDAMPNGGRLTIATAVSNGRAVIRITDTGEGMPDDVAARAFDPFYTTKDIGKGTGMGLSQVQGFIAQSGGEVFLRSEPGKGTTVEMALPMSMSSPITTTDADANSAQNAAGGATILVVEDEALVRKVAVAALEEAGHTVCEAGDGAAALELLAERDDIELMMTDIAMPRMDGRELAGRAREARPDLRILFTTGYDAQAGADDTAVLQKPYLSGELLAAVEATLAAS